MRIHNPTEKQIENAILSWLAIQGIYAFKINNTGTYDAKKGVFRSKHSVHRKLGISDILGIYKGRMLAIEVKSKTGRLSPHQVQFLKDVNDHGGIGFMARSIEDCARELNKEI